MGRAETGRTVSLEALALGSGTSVRDFPPLFPCTFKESESKKDPEAARGGHGGGEGASAGSPHHPLPSPPPEGHSLRRQSLTQRVPLPPVLLVLATFRKTGGTLVSVGRKRSSRPALARPCQVTLSHSLGAMPAVGWPLQEGAGPQLGSRGPGVSLLAPGALLQTRCHLSGVDLGRVTAQCPVLD